MDTKLFQKVMVDEKEFEIIGSGEMIDKPTFIGDWYCIPLKQYESTIPVPGIQAIDRILKSDLRIRGIIVAEDAKKIKQKEAIKINPPKMDGVNLAALGVALTAAMSLGFLLFVGLLSMLMTFDPLLIAITEENQWLLLYEWES